jgi:hypothetical protein
MLLRFIFYCLVAYAGFRFLRWLVKPAPARSNLRSPRSSRMVRCESCGLFVTEGSAMVVRGRDFCSKACAQRNLRST